MAASALPSGLLPRGLTREQAAAYMGLTIRQFSNRVRAGFLPAPLPGSLIWDRAALDARLDQQSGLVRSSQRSSSLEEEYDAWKASHAR